MWGLLNYRARRLRRSGAALAAALTVLLWAPLAMAKDAEAPDAARAPRKGQWIRIALPIDNSSVLRVKQTIARALGGTKGTRLIFILDFEAPDDAAEAGHGTAFDDAHKLARYLVSEDLNAATTVAYVPQSLKGHAVLVALACDEIIMAPKATIGEAGVDEKVISNTMLAAYEEIARTRRRIPADVALGMLDKSRQVIRATTEMGAVFVSPKGLDEQSREHRILAQDTIKPAGEAWQITGAEGRKWNLVDYLADERRDVTRALELSAEVAENDPSGGLPWHAVRLDLKGPVNHNKVEQLQRMIEEQRRDGVNFICLWIDSPGGSPLESKQLADTLAGLDRSQVRTVAYIAGEALADASLVAMACDHVVMRPQSTLGGSGAYQMTADEVGQFRQTLRDSLAPQKLRSWSIWAAMFDPALAVYRCTRLGDVGYYSKEELQALQPKAEKGEKGQPWVLGEAITSTGRPLKLTGVQALDYHVANLLVDNFAQFRERYGLENDPTLVEPGWADRIAQFLRSSEIAVLLLVVGGIALYIELHAPGLGLGGFIATVCFALFFWSRYLEGSVGWLQVTLFLTGIVCILIEFLLLPGMGIFGVGGGALVLASIIMAVQTFWIPRNDYQVAQLQHSLVTFSVAMAGMIVGIVLLQRWLPKAPILENVFLNPPEGEEAEVISRREMLVDFDNLLGLTGAATTPLGPGGKARFGNHLIDVITSGEFLPRDTRVVVIEVHGNRVVVRAAE